MPVTTLKKDIQLSDLDAWGTVADLGSEILEGEVNAFGKDFFVELFVINDVANSWFLMFII